ncbi:MAG: UDP-N-acetylmuramate dehydrogenase [Candidatus Berkelbacteria bacterium]
MNIDKILEDELGEKLKKNYLLKDHVSLHVGGVADYFYTAENIADLTHSVSLAHRLGLPYFVLGGGYNVVPSDSGFHGLVIKNKSSNIVFSPDFSTVIVDSGVNLGKLINLAAGRDLGGLEFLFGVPGTVGGAIYGNAGAFNYEIGDFVKSVTLLVPKEDKMTIVRHTADGMKFSYRSSRLKDKIIGPKPVILTATIQLVQRRKDEILRMMQDHLAIKKKTQPLEETSAGSFFKNIGLGRENAAGFLLEQAGAKNLRVGDAAFSKKHANFLVNKKNATSADVKKLAEMAKNLVKEKFNKVIEEEIEYIGRWS